MPEARVALDTWRANYADLCRRFPRYASWSFDTYPADDANAAALRVVKRYAGKYQTDDLFDDSWVDPGNTLYLHGPVGSGKTGLAWSILRQWGGGDFVNVRDLLAAARDYFTSGGRDPLEGLDTVLLLVLDDLGAERMTEWARETIATLVDRRYVRQLHTVVTSNYSPSELIRRIDPNDPIVGQRIVSRLTEYATVVHVGGADRRLNGGAG